MTDFFNMDISHYFAADSIASGNSFWGWLSTPFVRTETPLLFGGDSNPFGTASLTMPLFNFSSYFPAWNSYDFDLTSSSEVPVSDLKFDYSLSSKPKKTSLFSTKPLERPKVQRRDTFQYSSYVPSNKSRTGKSDGSHPIYTQTLNGTTIHTYAWANLNGLKPETQSKLVALSKEAEKHGYTLVASDCVRTHSQQAAGVRKKNGGSTKWCAPVGKSPHEYGCAFDLVLLDPNGKVVNIKDVSWFNQYATRNLNLDWGQNWSSKKEPWHFNLKDWQYRSDVRSEYIAYNGKLPNGQRA